MGHQKMRNEQMINQQIQKEDDGSQMYGQFYPENYYYNQPPSGYYNPDPRRSFDYSQGYRYPSPVGRQRRDPGMYASGPYYRKSKPYIQI